MARRWAGLFRAIINTGRSIYVIRFLKTRPSGVDGYKPFQDTSRNDLQLRKDSFVPILGIADQPLDCNKVIP